MADLPDLLAEYLETAVVSTRSPAWMHVAHDGALVGAGGPLGIYGIATIAPGDAVAPAVPMLEGLLPLDEPIELPCVGIGTGLPADIHLIPGEDGDWVLILDATSEAILRGLVQQRSNDLLLLQARHDALGKGPPGVRDIPSSLSAVLGALVIEEEASGNLVAIGRPPQWLARFVDPDAEPAGAGIVDRFAYLESFLVDAREFWARDAGAVLEGGSWEETDDTGTNASLDAVAVGVGGRRFIVVRHVDEARDERRRVIQRAREVRLDLDRLHRDSQQREVLFHCLVHDLAGPLTSMKAIFSMLERESLPDSMKRLVDIGTRQTARQEELIREMLDVFADERRVFDPATFDPKSAPDVCSCARSVVSALVPAARAKSVNLETEGCDEAMRVIGDRLVLERVISNLVENAIRHVPDGGGVSVRVVRSDETALVEVDDNGPGVPDSVAPTLFRRLSQGSGPRGKAGLGLYFVRMTVERWGGVVGFTPMPKGGSRFWFKLPVVESLAD